MTPERWHQITAIFHSALTRDRAEQDAFVAARCGAPVIVTPEDGDAGHYLGDDYPFYARSLAAADLEMAMATAAAGFGGPDWARACDIMAQVATRSSDAHVSAEFRLMIEAVIA